MENKEKQLQSEILAEWNVLYSEFLEKAKALNAKYKAESCGGYNLILCDEIGRCIGLTKLRLRIEEDHPQEYTYELPLVRFPFNCFPIIVCKFISK